MNARNQIEFDDEQIVQEHDEQGLDCPVCGLSHRVRYRLESERGSATCADCFLGWLTDHDATVTLTQD